MTAGTAATPATIDRSDFRHILLSGTKTGLAIAFAVIVFLAVSRLVPPGIVRTLLQTLVVVPAAVAASFLPAYWATARGTQGVASAAAIGLWGTVVFMAIDIILLLVTVIGGRIVPAFTANALRGRGLAADIRSSRWTDGIVIGAMIIVVLVDLLAPRHPIAGGVAAVAAVAQAWRLMGWRGHRTLKEPLVWSLHLAYAWLPAGLALKAIDVLTGANWAAHWLHALTVGVAASMILAVTSLRLSDSRWRVCSISSMRERRSSALLRSTIGRPSVAAFPV